MQKILIVLFLFGFTSSSQTALAQAPPADKKTQLESELKKLRRSYLDRAAPKTSAEKRQHADALVCIKATDWILRHDEFYKPNYVDQTLRVLKIGRERVQAIADGKPGLVPPGKSTVLGYTSRVDGSVQPYAVRLPAGVDPKDGKRWPLHLVLHGRAGTMNEVNFFTRHEGKAVPAEQNWIQLDVFGRTNNAYRWSGETDVFEALDDLKRRYRIDENRITLHGFSMGGAGAWHLGMHHPHMWSSVGPGAGFVDFYKYQNQKEQRPAHQHRMLGIYDSIDYALNAFNVPVVTYGGEKDKQLVASTSMVDAAKEQGVEIKLLVGPGMGHKFHPDSRKEFMAFHAEKSKAGRPRFNARKDIRFTTRTLKYNRCDWLAIEEVNEQYAPATVEASVKTDLEISAKNVAVLRISRGIANDVEIDGQFLPLANAADGLLPDVYYERVGDRWEVMDYDDSKSFADNPDTNKRHNLQGPIDDAFMESFVCIRGTGTAWSPNLHAWADWTLNRYDREFDKWLRGRIRIVDDQKADAAKLSADSNLILFGDPGSNSVLAEIVDRLPIEWTKDKISVNGESYSTKNHGVAFIYPNPLNPRRYVVINSGHTMHEKDFKSSNSWLFPRLGDLAVRKFSKEGDGYKEETVDAVIFNGGWQFPGSK